MQLLLWVGFGGRQAGPLDAELHAGFLRRHLLATAAISGFSPELREPCERAGANRANLVLQLGLPAAPPLLEDFQQLIQAGVVKVEDFILALSSGDHQLPARTGVVAEIKLKKKKNKTEQNKEV